MGDNLCNIIMLKAREYASKATDTPTDCTVIPMPIPPPQVVAQGMPVVALAMCIPCKYRWIASFDFETTNIIQLECPRCGAQDSFVSILPNMGEGSGL